MDHLHPMPCSAFLLLILLFNLAVSIPMLVLNTTDDSNGPLNAAELRQLRDFVRGRGSVSRLALPAGADPLLLPDPELGSNPESESESGMASLGAPPFKPFEVIMPPEFRQNNNLNPKIKKGPEAEPPEDYEKLAKLLQRFLANRNRTVEESMGKKGILEQKKTKMKKMEMVVDDEDEDWKDEEEDEGRRKGTSSFQSSTSTMRTTKMMIRGHVIGRVPVAVEIGDGGGKMKMKKEEDEEEDEKKDGSGRHEIPRKDNENDEDHSKQDKPGTGSWTGSVEKVVKLRTTAGGNRTQGAGTVRAARPVVRPQILGRLLIQPADSTTTRRTTMTSTTKAPEQLANDGHGDGERFFYQQVDNEDDTVTKPNTTVQVHFLREGLARQAGADYIFVASITLIRDGDKLILVDTGMGTDINGHTDLIKKLDRLGIAPPSVDFVITTHGHPDHAGNINAFPDATHFQGAIIHHRTRFRFSDLFENDRHQLTQNVALIRTPGHTAEDISVLVRNADGYGNVVVAGDVFIAEEDLQRPRMWRPLAWDESVQTASRRRVLCAADWVVPGHGRAFRVRADMRVQAGGCAATES